MVSAVRKHRLACFWGKIGIMTGVWVLAIFSAGQVRSEEEVTSPIYRYRERVATGYYEGYEVSPRRLRARVKIPVLRRGLFPFGSSAAVVQIRSHLPDSHRALSFYERRTCIECHARQARNLHSVRAGITCRQCHGPEPIAAINHYFSPMNPIRRHAYICSKCHEGANSGFAGFYVHEPPGTSLSTRKSFPILFYTSWGMLLLLIGTLAFFVPHALMVGARELFEKTETPKNLIRKMISFIRDVILAGLKKLWVRIKTRKNETEDAP